MVKEKQNSIRTFSIASKSKYGDSIVTQMSFDVADSFIIRDRCLRNPFFELLWVNVFKKIDNYLKKSEI